MHTSLFLIKFFVGFSSIFVWCKTEAVEQLVMRRPYEEAFIEGKKIQRQVLVHLLPHHNLPDDLGEAPHEQAFWTEARKQFCKVMEEDQGEFHSLTNLLGQSNACFTKSLKLHPHFPYPLYYMGINWCMGGNVLKAEDYCRLLENKEKEQQVIERKWKFPLLQALIGIHIEMNLKIEREKSEAQRLYLFNEMAGFAVAAFTLVYCREHVMQGVGNVGQSLLGPGYGDAWKVLIELRNIIPGCQFLIEPAIIFTLTKNATHAVFDFAMPYVYKTRPAAHLKEE